MKAFVKSTLAARKDYTDLAIAEQNYKFAQSAISQQMAALGYESVKAETEKETAEVDLLIAKYPASKLINNMTPENFIVYIESAANRVEVAKRKIATIAKRKAFAETLKAEFDEEVAAPVEQPKA